MKLLALLLLLAPSDFTGDWSYRQGSDKQGERLELRLREGQLTGLYHGLEREGEHGLFHTLVEIRDVKVEGRSLSFVVPERRLYAKLPASGPDQGFTRDVLHFSGELRGGGELVLRCRSDGASCPDDTMLFLRGLRRAPG